MKSKKLIKFISFIIIIVTLLCSVTLPSSAVEFRTGANSASSSYKSGPYYSNLSAVTLTGDNRTDVLAIALSQLGYQEGASDGQYSGTAGGSNNYTEYNRNIGTWSTTVGYGGSSYAWCASFVSFCLFQARCHNYTKFSDWCRDHTGDKNYIWKEISCVKWAEQLRRYDYFKYSSAFGGNYKPIYGDLIFFTSSGTKDKESHIGLVLWSDSTTVYTVEGNTSSGSGLDTNGGGVYFKSYSLTSSKISGYGVLPYKTDDTVRKIDYSGKDITPGLYVATTNKYVYTTETATDYTWLLPRHSMFTVTEIASNGRVKATCTINGQTVTGYIKNNGDRIIQLTATDAYIATEPETPTEPDSSTDTENPTVPDTPTEPDTPTVPEANPVNPPRLLTYSPSTVTLEPIDGYEYKMGDGEWQTSNIFTNVNKEQKYMYYQRKAGDESTESAGLGICINYLLDARKLTYLRIEGASLLPSFSPDIIKYEITVPADTERLNIEAITRQGSEIEISDYSFDESGTAKILITVIPPIGAERVYTVIATKQASAENFTDAPIETGTANETNETGEDSDSNESTDALEVGCESSLGLSTASFIILLSLGAGLTFEKKRERNNL